MQVHHTMQAATLRRATALVDAAQPLLTHEHDSAATSGPQVHGVGSISAVIDIDAVRRQQRAKSKQKSARPNHDDDDREESKQDARTNKRSKNDDATDDHDGNGSKAAKKHSVSRTSPSDNFDGEFAVDVRGLSHSYSGKKEKLTLNSIDLQIEMGKIYGLLGPSGCGQ
jgi:ABC-type glutathione transport system ATPase component